MASLAAFILLNNLSAGGQLEQPSDVNNSTKAFPAFGFVDFIAAFDASWPKQDAAIAATINP